jgi:hypothetical protein
VDGTTAFPPCPHPIQQRLLEERTMSKRHNKFWVWLSIILSVVVVVVGFPAFERDKGFPTSILWTLAAVLGVWLTYFVRAYLWGNDKAKGDSSTEGRDEG